MSKQEVSNWKVVSRNSLEAAQALYREGNWRGCTNRCYYAAYQAATAISLIHGDDDSFPLGRRNPSHEQLPDLIKNNGNLPIPKRRRISTSLRVLRHSREDADYRPGRTVAKDVALTNLHLASDILELLEIEEST